MDNCISRIHVPTSPGNTQTALLYTASDISPIIKSVKNMPTMYVLKCKRPNILFSSSKIDGTLVSTVANTRPTGNTAISRMNKVLTPLDTSARRIALKRRRK
jgi:hypothetical protein